MIRVRVDIEPAGRTRRSERIIDLRIHNNGAPDRHAERDPYGERLYRWSTRRARGMVRHRRVDGLALLVAAVLADLAKAPGPDGVREALER